MRGIGAGHDPDLVDAIAIQVEGQHRREPHAGHRPGAEIAAPHQLAIGRDHRELERVRREEEHLLPGIDVEVGAIRHHHSGTTITEAQRRRPALPDALAEVDGHQRAQIDRGHGRYRSAAADLDGDDLDASSANSGAST